jgi:flagellin
MGGRAQEMTFGLGRVKYSNMYVHNYVNYYDDQGLTGATDGADKEILAMADLAKKASNGYMSSPTSAVTGQAIFIEGVDYEVTTAFSADADVVQVGNAGDTALTDTATNNKAYTVIAADGGAGTVRGTTGAQFTASASGQIGGTGHAAKSVGQLVFAASEGMYHTTLATGEPATPAGTNGQPITNLLTNEVEVVQARINTARVEAGSQYAALESAVNYTTDLTAQYELGYNTVNDVNFSMETAHLAKNQILQQAATAMLAQANQGQQGLLQLIS